MPPDNRPLDSCIKFPVQGACLDLPILVTYQRLVLADFCLSSPASTRCSQPVPVMADKCAGQSAVFCRWLTYRFRPADSRYAGSPLGLACTHQSDLARKRGVSLQWIYKIVKAVRKDEIARRQADMFAPPDVSTVPGVHPPNTLRRRAPRCRAPETPSTPETRCPGQSKAMSVPAHS